MRVRARARARARVRVRVTFLKRVLGLSPRSSRSLFITRCGRCVLNMPGTCMQIQLT